MVKIMMHGCNGVMGQVISKIVEETEGAVMACGVDRVDDGHNDYPVFTDINACDVEVDAIIDFSAAPAVDGLLDFAVERQIPVVLCTTGLSDEQLERVHEASKKTAVLRSANMSLGVNTLFKVLKSMTKLLADAGFDIDIVEKHHRRKLDAPSFRRPARRADRRWSFPARHILPANARVPNPSNEPGAYPEWPAPACRTGQSAP